MINISFPDGNVRQYPAGSTPMDIASSISEGLARNVLSAKVNGKLTDRDLPLHQDATLALLTWNDQEGKETFWHSTAHLMAEALEALYPGIKFGYGPAGENGFFYDVDPGEGVSISSDDLPRIEEKMLELARGKNDYVRQEISKADAIAYFTAKGDEYKLELLEDLEDGSITFYTQGGFTDLCRGPHIPNTGIIKAVKLLKLAGAYWRGNEENKQLTRIYGISFPKAKDLTDYLTLLEEAKKRDHRKLGKELELFMFSEKVGAGLPMWLPKGTQLRERLVNYLKVRQEAAGYQQVTTPHIGKKDLYVTSGHWDKYGEDSFQPIKTPREGEEFMLKPMNCPHHCEMYKFRPRSYRELPLRLSEFGTVYRYEQTGELHGLSRVRGFTQDDAHIFCTPEQVKGEFLAVVDIVREVLGMIGFNEVTAQISLRDPANPGKYIGSDENWRTAEQAIIDACAEIDMKTVTAYGEAAFYGPKLDFMVRDALGRQWQLGTVQVDYNLPERFELEYIGPDNDTHRPVMIHRAPFGSLERFTSILIEHTGGKFPLWLAPEQFAILPISEKFNAYSQEILQELAKHDIRGMVDDRNETIGRKIRDTELKRIPFMLIVGEKELEAGGVAVRIQGEGDKGTMTIPEFVDFFQTQL
ncbi:threonine--tRNA ligase [Neolewinella lacunae]|uniref:Threonine--tRNA ligase n=1 Tax=Neolewinella lacunae TaxID=1517758 RepID=A0A923PRZ5_9BACT|nr:threonine--tRNA ligase [Neolewinella lacunae]MBC6996393.1 threonine--tRNA ligase [Neolewinella lacunae]MDN3633664.1 threonine--tRNA ligase [Neolewinella lacunae]